MKIYVVQYNDSGSPTGEVIAVRSELKLAQQAAQSSESVKDSGQEELEWRPSEFFGLYTADGYEGEYTISEWEVAIHDKKI